MKRRGLPRRFRLWSPESACQGRLALEALGSLDQRAENPRLPRGMPGVGHDPVLGLRPSPMQLMRGYERANHVITPLNDRSRDFTEPVRVFQQRVSVEKNVVREIVRLDPRKSQGNDVPGKVRDGLGTGKQSRAGSLVDAPGARGWHVDRRIGVDQATVIIAQ